MSRKNKIHFITSSIFNRRDYHRFGLDILLNRGYEVMVWDLSPLLRPKYYKNYKPKDIIENAKYLKLIHNKIEFNKVGKNGTERSIFVLNIGTFLLNI